jgi:hypothetical protein
VRRALLSVVVASLALVAWSLLHGCHGPLEGLVMLAPALAFALPLLAGRYLGERTIDRVRTARVAAPAPRRDRRAAALRRRPTLALVPRGGLLLASSLATRPPPALT